MSSSSEYSVLHGTMWSPCRSDCNFSRDFFIMTDSIRNMNNSTKSDNPTTQSSFGTKLRRLLAPAGPLPRPSRFRTRIPMDSTRVIPTSSSSLPVPPHTPPPRARIPHEMPRPSPQPWYMAPPVDPPIPIELYRGPRPPAETIDDGFHFVPSIKTPTPLKPGQKMDIFYDERQFCMWYRRGQSNFFSLQKGLGSPKWRGENTSRTFRSHRSPSPPLRSPTLSRPTRFRPKMVKDDVLPVTVSWCLPPFCQSKH